jgi:hypothetical protein
MNILLVIVATFLVNVWANDGRSANGDWPGWVGDRLIPFVFAVAIVLGVSIWSERRTARIVVRGCVIALIASLLNLLPFVLRDISDSVNGRPTSALSRTAGRNGSSNLWDQLLAVIDPKEYRSRVQRREEQEQYVAAINQCIEERRKQDPASDNKLRFECVSTASRLGPSEFQSRYGTREAALKQ